MRSRLPLLVLPAVMTALLAAGCSVEDVPTAAPSGSADAPVEQPSSVPAPGEAQDPCTQLALSRLDGLLGVEPSAPPEAQVRANEVVQEFVEAYDEVLSASGGPAARAAVAADVSEACKLPPGEGNVVQIPVEPEPSPT